MDDKILEAFTFGKIQDCANIMHELARHGVSWEEFQAWVKDKIPRIRDVVLPHRRCPECGSWLRLGSVNDHKARMVGGSWKSQWWCRCGWYELSEKEEAVEGEPYLGSAKNAKRKDCVGGH